MKLASRVVCLVAAALLLSSVAVLAEGWTAVGERAADFSTKSVTIEATGSTGPFSRLKLEVDKNILQVGRVTVTFADGEAYGVDLNSFVGAGRSQVVDLPSAKEVRKVELTYRKPSAAERRFAALVKVYGSA